MKRGLFAYVVSSWKWGTVTAQEPEERILESPVSFLQDDTTFEKKKKKKQNKLCSFLR